VAHFHGPAGDGTRGSGADPRDIALEITDAVESLTGLWSLSAQGAVMRLSLHQLRALRALQGDPGLNLTALAARLDIGMPTASRLCDRLEAAGLLERSSHPSRRREVRLSLTRQGRAVLDEVAGRRTSALADVLAQMKPADRAAFSRGLEAFLTAQRSAAPEAGDGRED
jgi:DNA-binding MarR family transcriptional regulator